MSDEYNDLNADDDNDSSEASGAPAPNRGNRTFGLAAGILGGVFLLALILMALFALVILPRQRAARETQIAQINANNTVTAQALTQQAADQAQTVIPKGPTNTAVVLATQPVATNTPVIAVASPTPQFDPTQIAARNTATVAALLTQVAQSQLTTTPQAQLTSTALPTTGFADEVGIPGLFGLALVLIAVIFVVRRLRSA